MINQSLFFARIAATLLLFLTFTSMAQRTRQALKSLEELEFDKVLENLEKSLEKDSLNPATQYVYSLLHVNDSFPGYSIDLGHMYIERGLELLQVKNDDHIKEMEKSEIYEQDFRQLDLHIDSLAFEDVRKSASTVRYLDFMVRYADSRHIQTARTELHALYYQEALETNTWQSYQKFINENPDASQVADARNRFNELVYLDKTSSGKLEDLEDFLIEYPASPYRKTIEQKIFDFQVADLDTDQLYDFINAYHNPNLTKKSYSLLYHLDKLDKEQLKSFNHKSYQDFIDSVKSAQLYNDLRLIPLYENGKFYFSDLKGNRVLANDYQNVKKSYKCGFVQTQLIEVGHGHQTEIVDRQGRVIFSGVENFSELGNGMIKVEKNGRFGVIHITGFPILPIEYDDVLWLGSRYFLTESKNGMDLVNFGGESVTKGSFDNIYLEGNYWIFEKQGKIAISNLDQLIAARKPFEPDFSRSYEEIELIDNKYLIAFEENTEVLFNEILEIITPPQTNRINTRFDTWVFQMAEGYWTFDRFKGKVSEYTYDSVLQNEEWLAVQRNQAWEVYGKNLQEQPILAIDSVKLLGQDIAIVFRESQGMAIFPNKEIVNIEEGQHLTSLGRTSGSKAHFLVTRQNGKNILYRDGIKLFETDFEEIGYISDQAFTVKKGHKYGAVDEQGRLVMRVRYDAIGRAEDGVATVLYDGKFGAFNFTDRVLLALDFDQKFSPFNQEYFEVLKDGKFGLLDRRNNLVAEPVFDEINYWSDTLFFGKEDGYWHLLGIKDQIEILTEIIAYDYIKNTKEEKVIWYQTADGTGVFHSQLGQIIPPVFNDVYNLGSEDELLYFAERAFPEAGYYIVVYYNAEGQKIKTAAYRSEEFEKVICEDL